MRVHTPFGGVWVGRWDGPRAVFLVPRDGRVHGMRTAVLGEAVARRINQAYKATNELFVAENGAESPDAVGRAEIERRLHDVGAIFFGYIVGCRLYGLGTVAPQPLATRFDVQPDLSLAIAVGSDFSPGATLFFTTAKTSGADIIGSISSYYPAPPLARRIMSSIVLPTRALPNPSLTVVQTPARVRLPANLPYGTYTAVINEDGELAAHGEIGWPCTITRGAMDSYTPYIGVQASVSVQTALWKTVPTGRFAQSGYFRMHRDSTTMYAELVVTDGLAGVPAASRVTVLGVTPTPNTDEFVSVLVQCRAP